MQVSRLSTHLAISLWLLLAVAALAAQDSDTPREDWPVVRATSPAARVAVLQLSDGGMMLIRTGDKLAGRQAVLRKILEDRLIFEERLPEPDEGESRPRVVHLMRAEGTPPRSEVRILDRWGPDAEILSKPVVETLDPREPSPRAESEAVGSDEAGDQDGADEPPAGDPPG